MKKQLIEELYSLIDNPNCSLVGILNKSIRLATLCNQDEYRQIFTLHLRGIQYTKEQEAEAEELIRDIIKNKTSTSSEDTPKIQLNWVMELLEDRQDYNGNINTFSMTEMELRYKECERLARSIDNNHELKALMLNGNMDFIKIFDRIRARVLAFLTKIENIDLSEKIIEPVDKTILKKIFIGHGHSAVWRDLKDFLQERLGLEWDEYNREVNAGMAIKERLEQTLNNASFAFLVMTAEDEHADETFHARENVVHEVGLFQGKLGFRKAIVLLEEGCQEFSNIHGLSQIHFPKDNIMARSEEIRRVLEREGIMNS